MTEIDLISMMKLMKFRSSKVDPVHFVYKLGALISQARGVKFIVNRANDVPKVLGYMPNGCSPNAPTLVSMFSQPPSRWIDLAMYAFRPPAQKNKSLCLEYLSEALSSFPFKIFSYRVV